MSVLGGEGVVDKLHTDNPGMLGFEVLSWGWRKMLVIVVVDWDGGELWWNGDGMVRSMVMDGSDELATTE